MNDESIDLYGEETSGASEGASEGTSEGTSEGDMALPNVASLDLAETPAIDSGESLLASLLNSPADEPIVPPSTVSVPTSTEPIAMESSESVNQRLEQRVADLQRREQELRQEIRSLKIEQAQMLQDQVVETQTTMGRVIQESLRELEQRRHTLQLAVEQLERRQERIRGEMRTSFAGASQDLAIRVQGFKDYLVGSLQDLVSSAEQLQLTPTAKVVEVPIAPETSPKSIATPAFAQQSFQDQTKQIRNLIDRYRTSPDYYGAAWQLRRTFEPVHAERVSDWFFTQGGRGALRSLGSRLQNILVTSAVISILREFYDDRLRTLIVANSPERLGEWRRGLQDCLGISRSDFGPEGGVVMFEVAEALVQKADRLVKQGQLPLIIVDESEDQISLGLLQFPLWLAFTPDPRSPKYSDNY